jgi:hypothetical protein
MAYEILVVFIFGSLVKSANSIKIKLQPNIGAIQYFRSGVMFLFTLDGSVGITVLGTHSSGFLFY